MLAFIRSHGRGDDAVLRNLARRLQAEGVRLAGAVQENCADNGRPCSRMDLVVLDGLGLRDERIDISQQLGEAALGCRLNPDGLEHAVGLIASDLDRRAAVRDMVILNKFGKQEAEGGGFRPVIAQALEAGLPVVTKVSRDAEPAFAAFVGELAEELPGEEAALLSWCRRQLGREID